MAANGLGVRSTRDQLEGEIDWLVEMGLVKRADAEGFVVKLEPAGIEVAKGQSNVKGVKRPTVD